MVTSLLTDKNRVVYGWGDTSLAVSWLPEMIVLCKDGSSVPSVAPLHTAKSGHCEL